MPGHSLGKVWLGAPHSTVRKVWGQPFLIRRQGSYTAEVWHTGKDDSYPSKTAIFRNNRVVQLETTSPRFQTPHGISVGSKLGDIRRMFGEMRVISFGLDAPDPQAAEHANHYLESRARGLAFELDLGFRPDLSSDKKPHVLYVHPRGQRFVRVYGEQVWSQSSPK